MTTTPPLATAADHSHEWVIDDTTSTIYCQTCGETQPAVAIDAVCNACGRQMLPTDHYLSVCDDCSPRGACCCGDPSAPGMHDRLMCNTFGSESNS